MKDLEPWLVEQYYWGTVVRHRKGKPDIIFLNGGQEIDVSDIDIIIHENGIEFIKI
jgi:hypothetical protein